jgi:hypothetical protein
MKGSEASACATAVSAVLGVWAVEPRKHCSQSSGTHDVALVLLSLWFYSPGVPSLQRWGREDSIVNRLYFSAPLNAFCVTGNIDTRSFVQP